MLQKLQRATPPARPLTMVLGKGGDWRWREELACCNPEEIIWKLSLKRSKIAYQL